MRLGSGTAVVVVPGRAPLCLRFRNMGHIRRDCRVPRCAGCRAFGQEQADCTRSYASAASRATNADHPELLMDEDEAERAVASKTVVEASHAVATSEREMETPKQDTDENTVMGTRTQRRSTRIKTPHKSEQVIGSDATSDMDTVETTPGSGEWLAPKSLGVLAACIRRRFHAAATGRRLERRPDSGLGVDFRAPLEEVGLIKAITGIGAFQMNHILLVKMRSKAEKDALLKTGGLQVKSGFCALIDPIQHDVTVKIHWGDFAVSNESIRQALSEFGEVLEVSNENWTVAGFEHTTSTTKVV
ncbi:hypothetical protein HPB51_005575 [Rhipicephalus microplus]|uniref:Uncharacterized protein n=1 Tax=Rhipicephalus microplus TaxID=6941 RepID=A0A9J6D3K0_RHIMP|nr:hypothetical protein HPB51_005575 [Rhipicephalus microplus]